MSDGVKCSIKYHRLSNEMLKKMTPKTIRIDRPKLYASLRKKFYIPVLDL